MSLVRIITIISHLPILAAVIGYAWVYPKLGKALKAFSWFIFLSGSIQFPSLFLFLNGKHNLPLLHFYVAAGVPVLAWFYKTVLGNYISSRILWGIVVCFLVFTVINSVFIQGINRFNSNALVVESIIIIILSLFTFVFFLNDTMKETEIPDKKSLNRINSGLFIYYLSCLLIFYFGDMVLFHFAINLVGITWMFHSFFSVVMYTCFLTALWKRSKTQHS